MAAGIKQILVFSVLSQLWLDSFTETALSKLWQRNDIKVLRPKQKQKQDLDLSLSVVTLCYASFDNLTEIIYPTIFPFTTLLLVMTKLPKSMER